MYKIHVELDKKTVPHLPRRDREEGVSPPVVFSGWTRNGYWCEGKLLNTKYGRVIHDPQEKLVPVNASAAEHKAARDALAKLWQAMPDFLTGTRHRKQVA